MRTYTWEADRPGGDMFWPEEIILTECRIRQFVLVLFKKWFGHWPKHHWYSNGMMAQAWDGRGNRITVNQYNNNNPLRTAPNPRLYILREKYKQNSD